MTSGKRASGCALCQLTGVPEGGRLPEAGVVVAYVDEELIGLIPADRPGLSLAPRGHLSSLFEVPERAGILLACLRRLVVEVKSSYGVEEATIEPTSELRGAAGHVCFHVVPVWAGEGEVGEVSSDVSTRAAALAEILGRLVADRPDEPPMPPHQGPTLRSRH